MYFATRPRPALTAVDDNWIVRTNIFLWFFDHPGQTCFIFGEQAKSYHFFIWKFCTVLPTLPTPNEGQVMSRSGSQSRNTNNLTIGQLCNQNPCPIRAARVRNWICLCASGAIYELERSCRQLNDSHPLILCAILSHPLWSAHHHSVRQAAVMRLHIFSRSCHLSLPGSNFSLDLIHFMISPCCKGSG